MNKDTQLIWEASTSKRRMDFSSRTGHEGINVSREHFAEIQVKLGNWLNEKGAETVVVPKRSIGGLDFHESILDDMGDNDAAIRLEIVTDWFEATGKVSSREPTQEIFEIYSGDPIYFSEEQQKVIDYMSPTKHWKEDPNRPNRSPEAITILNDNRRGSSIVYGGLVALATGADLTGPPEVRPPITTEVITEYVNGLLSEYLAGYGKRYKEGKKVVRKITSPVRSPDLIRDAKLLNEEQNDGLLTCNKCRLQPSKDYYHRGEKVTRDQSWKIIEGHHIEGVQEKDATPDDIEMLCKNCHIYETRIKI
jgi:hypothetical protein